MNSHFQFGSVQFSSNHAPSRPRPHSNIYLCICSYIWGTVCEYLHNAQLSFDMANCHEMVRAYFPDVKGAVQMHYESQKKP